MPGSSGRISEQPTGMDNSRNQAIGPSTLIFVTSSRYYLHRQRLQLGDVVHDDWRMQTMNLNIVLCTMDTPHMCWYITLSRYSSHSVWKSLCFHVCVYAHAPAKMSCSLTSPPHIVCDALAHAAYKHQIHTYLYTYTIQGVFQAVLEPHVLALLAMVVTRLKQAQQRCRRWQS